LPETSAWSEQVNLQLQRVLRAPEFNKSKRLKKLLSYVVAKTLSGEEKIRSYNIAVDVFDKGDGFDPGDPYVRNIARHARLALDKYYRGNGRADPIRIDIPAGNYVATFEKLSSASFAASKPQTNEAELKAAIAGSEAANEANGVGVRLWPVRATDNSSPTIAIIPFRYHGSMQDQENVIGEMLAAGVITGLSKSSHFNVISRLTTNKLRNVDWSLKQIAEQLGCDYVMSGSYLCHKGRVKLLVELADCASSEVVWAGELPCTVEALLREEDEVTDELIYRAGDSIISQEVKRARFEPLETLTMHTKLVAGIYHMHSRVESGFIKSRLALKQILLSYPTHTTVNAQLAHWYVLQLNRKGGWNSGLEEKRSAAEHYLERALESDPRNSLALTVSGLVETQFNRNPEKGLELYNRAEGCNSNEPLTYAYKAAVLSYKGQGQEAIRCANKALSLSPFDPQLNMFHTCAAAAYYAVDDYENAERHAERAFEINPQHTSNLRTLVAIQMDLGKTEKARLSAQRLLESDPMFTTSSYLSNAPAAAYQSGRQIADRLAYLNSDASAVLSCQHGLKYWLY
jgi:TolB-like protein